MRLYLIQTVDSLAAELTSDCVGAGYTVLRLTSADPEYLRSLSDDRADALLVSLEDDHDACLDLLDELRTRRRMRGIPIVFTGGTQAALARAQESYPRASYSRRDVLLNVLASLKS